MGLADRDYLRWPYWRPGYVETEPPVRDFEHHRRWKRARRENRVLRFVNWIVALGVVVSLTLTIAEVWPTDMTWGHVADWIGMHLP